MEVKPASGATFEVKPSYSSEFIVKPSSYANFKVEPTSSARFKLENDKYTPIYVASDSYKPVVVTPAKDAIFKVEQTGSSIYSDKASIPVSTYAYPNPANEKITIVYSTFSQGEYLTICNMDGKIIDHISLDSSQKELSVDLSRYTPGIYIYNFNGNGGKFVVKR